MIPRSGGSALAPSVLIPERHHVGETQCRVSPALDRMCTCSVGHATRLAGSETAKAAEGLQRFYSEYAAALGAQIRMESPRLGEAEAEAMAGAIPPAYGALWVNDFLCELPWRVCASRPVSGDAHVNVRELRAALRHGIAEAGVRRSLQLLLVVDSRVVGGAMGKGCSAARLLNAELRPALPDILGRDPHTWDSCSALRDLILGTPPLACGSCFLAGAGCRSGVVTSSGPISTLSTV